jgi:UDP-glucuronate 4-epimerase
LKQIDLTGKRIVVTGSAGFIGYTLTRALLEQGHAVWGFDNLNDYYDVSLKEGRLKALDKYSSHAFRKGALENTKDVAALFAEAKPDIVINLAAQAGVRYSLINPQAYIDSNLTGFTNILEESRKGNIEHLVYASSSSVYGANANMPFSETHNVSHPLSLYAATKKANELMAHSYSNIYNLPTTGLRFFTVYGPWGRPDMAMFLFANAIMSGKPINVFNHGNMRRDFTYVDDIVSGVIGAAKTIPTHNEHWDAMSADPSSSRVPWTVYNLGNNKPENLMDVISLLENALDREAVKTMLPLQAGDVPETCANIDRAQRDFGFKPQTSIEQGIAKFIEWYRGYYNA